jgi:glycosyltransferase involved in cell wall biosynthesis
MCARRFRARSSEAKAAALGVSACVTFLGRVSDERLACEYERCTAVVMPSPGEGFGLVFVEAMRAARGCIGSHGSAAEIIVNGETGMLVDAHDRAGVTAAVVRMLQDRAAAAAMGARGRARFLNHFTEDHFRSRLTALLPQGGAMISGAIHTRPVT